MYSTVCGKLSETISIEATKGETHVKCPSGECRWLLKGNNRRWSVSKNASIDRVTLGCNSRPTWGGLSMGSADSGGSLAGDVTLARNRRCCGLFGNKPDCKGGIGKSAGMKVSEELSEVPKEENRPG